MPLTAWNADGHLVDASDVEDATWLQVHRVRPRPALTCRGCSGVLHAKVSPTGLRFFAHDRKIPHCPSAAETPEHRVLKHVLAAAARRCGWTALIEAEPSVTDVGGWRADVLAVSADGRRHALEAQLAAMTPEVGAERAARYAADGIDTTWFTTKDAHWLMQLEGAKVSGAEVDTATVVRGVARRTERGSWEMASELSLDRFLKHRLEGTLVPLRIDYFHEELPRGEATRSVFHHDALLLVKESDRSREELARERARLEAEREEERRRRHEANIAALERRRAIALPVALSDAIRAAVSAGTRVWLGVPACEAPTDRAISEAQLTRLARGNERTAAAAVIWLGADRQQLSMFAVVCPVASRVTPGLAATWRRRGTRVYVADAIEATRLAQVLAWPMQQVRVASSGRESRPSR